MVAFGREIGRVLSDGTIVGRAEPFAKVFPSSRAVKRVVGPTAWTILEDIALDAHLDREGRLVAETNVRQIADNLGLGKNTVQRHLSKLRDHGFVLHEEQRETGSGRYETARYVLDPSACLERFTTTPTRDHPESADGRSAPSDGSFSPCTNSWDTVEQPVSPISGHRDRGQNNKRVVGEDQQQPHAASDGTEGGKLAGRLIGLGIDADTAAALLADHPAGQVRDALDAVEDRDVRSEAGWVVSAIREGWDLTAELADRRTAERQRRQQAEQAAARRRQAEENRRRDRRTAGWQRALSAALDDQQLALATDRVADQLPAAVAGSPPAVRAALTRLAVKATAAHPDRPLDEAVLRTVADPPADPAGDASELPAPPAVAGEPAELSGRLRGLLETDRRDLPDPEIALEGP